MKPAAQTLLPLLARLGADPLLIRPDCTHLIGALAQRALATRHKSAVADSTDGEDDEPCEPWDDAEAVRLLPGGVAVVSMRGVICAGLDPMTAWYFGLCRPEAIQAAIATVQSDPTIRLVIFDIDSPGGYTTAVPETAQLLAGLSSRKATLAFTSGMMCSAAYWLGSQCEKIVVMPSATIGSVGTYATVYDFSKMYAEAGIAAHLIAAGEFKGQGTPGVPVSEKYLALIQANVDRINGKFLAAVRAGRGSLADEDLQGQWFDGEQAVAKNLADATALNLAEVVGAVLTPDLSAIA